MKWTPAPNVSGYAISIRPLDSSMHPDFHLVDQSQSGDVVLNGFDPDTTYAVSLAAVERSGLLGYFSLELLVHPDDRPPSDIMSN